MPFWRERGLDPSVPGWSWDVLADRWDEAFAYLQEFEAREGHARVPTSHIENGFRLGQWVNHQRARYARSALGADRVRRLEAFPRWSWRTRRPRRAATPRPRLRQP